MMGNANQGDHFEGGQSFMRLQEELQLLKNYENSENYVLTIYLNTDPADPEQRNDAWKIHLKNGMKELEETIPSSTSERELHLFKKLEKKVLKEIEANQTNLNKGIIIFASTDPELWSVHYVQVRIKTDFYWGEKPELEQLYYINKAYPHAGVILPAFNEVRIIDTAMGVVNDELIYEFDAGSEEWKRKKGIAYGSVRASSATHVDAFDDRLRENLFRFYKQMGVTIGRLAKDRQWKEIHVSGEAELANTMAKALPKEPVSKLYKNLKNNKSNQVLHEVFEK